MGRRIHIVIAEASVILRSGMVSVLQRMATLNVDVAEISEIQTLTAQLPKYKPDILIVDPYNLGVFSLQQIKKDAGCLSMKIVALQNTLTDNTALKHYDETISVYDSAEVIENKLKTLYHTDDSEVKQELSVREKEVVVCVVKGMTNKQIAEQLCLSAHTVMTHRKNIANKLQIHSSSGLTIYAIVNKLVEIDEIKSTISMEI